MALLKDLGYTPRCSIHADASAALGIISRRGLGKVRHLDVSHLWIQEIAARKMIRYEKVPGSQNPADIFTKAGIDSATVSKHVAKLGGLHIEGRAEKASQL